jgi:hypothetical protein
MSTTTTYDLLLTNAHVLTMDEAFTAYPSGFVAIAGSSILAVGNSAQAGGVSGGGDDRLPRARRHARPRQRAYACADDDAERAGG